ncbi:hypothetical protein F5B18DRAFT_610036 [Nemania serpens]|nr:hypothetical protein F5B18DRAFT_610036 [Nemania serpens]
MPDPVEIVSPVIVADEGWTTTIDSFWDTMNQFFDIRQDTTCGFHVHISFQQGHFTLPQL